MQLEHEDLAARGTAPPPLAQHKPVSAASVPWRAGDLVLSSESRADALVVSLRGELDLASVPALSRELEIAEETASERVVIDLSGLEFIDSSGLHELMRAHRRATDRSRRLSLRRGPRAVQRVFELIDGERLFTFED